MTNITYRGRWRALAEIAAAMLRIGIPCLAFAFCSMSSGRAQVAAPPPANPASTTSPQGAAAPARQRPAPRPPEPMVNPDGSVSFSLAAPGAKEVRLEGQAGSGPMTRDDKGVWTFTSAPLSPEIYEYHFVVDGLSVSDPRNGWVRSDVSLINVPARAGTPPLPWEFTAVPHGTVAAVYYQSGAAGGVQRRVHIYTPPGYNPNKRETYPTFYLLHGSGDDDASWVDVSHANFIFDNLIAQKLMRPMVVVMPYGFMPRRADREAFGLNLLNDLLPFVEQNYRVKKDADNRALAGLSMGGSQSLNIGLRHADDFGYIGAWSSGPVGGSTAAGLDAAFPEIVKSGAKALPDVKRLYLSCGDVDGLLPTSKAVDSWLSGRQVPHEFHVKPGNHQWSVWRASLIEFSQLLFKD